MRIIRFRARDGRVFLGEDHGDGEATILLDAEGILGPGQADLVQREVLRGKRALIADDDEGIRRAVGAALERFECECTVCKDGAEAIRAIGEKDLDVVVSDIVMPHHDGYEVFEAAKDRSDSLAVVLVTGFGYDPNHTIVRASQQGCEAVLYKPFTPQKLVETVSNAIRMSTNGKPSAMVRGSERVRTGTLLAPLVPRDILCAGRNYGDAAGDLELFMKPRSAVLGPGRPIVIPAGLDGDQAVDCEGELGVVIGAEARGVPENEALDHVLGYVVANDVTATRWQRSDIPQAWMRGKGFDTFCPVGPSIVTADEVPDPGGRTITTTVNGHVTRRGNTSQMSRPVGCLISQISGVITLYPGTLLLTGAPPRLEPDRPPGLQAGDEVSVEIDGIGRMTNTVEGPS